MKFEIIKTDKKARAGLLSLNGNTVETPTFMPVATRGTIKSTPHEYLNKTSILLANASLHLGVATSLGEYSPGMITSLFMYLPLYIYSILLSSRNQLHFRTILLLSVLGFVIHFILLMWITVF